ncbi:MAG TPA: tRNA uridine-5-carboxymethylaminomethyl(34) synthesis enzyme MnmG [bacterium]
MAHRSEYDIIVVGAGHAGIEAALAGSRMGCHILLLTLNIDTIGHMSCNPSVGGLAKGHLVKELDVLGGEIALLADRTAVQYRMLNRSKGPAVWSPRTQNDRQQYKDAARHVLEIEKNIIIKQEEAAELLIEQGAAIGIRTTIGNEYHGRALILTTGTFLNGLMHVGMETMAGGRLGEATVSRLSASLQSSGLALGRLKTGTSPRVAKNNVQVAGLREQPGDLVPVPFSYRTSETLREQLSCYVTHTNESTHTIINKNLDRSPLFTGRITGVGPRYCPSIETKITRFKERTSHIIFIEPEGFTSSEYYLNGLSTSLPYDVQVDLLHSIAGLEQVEITRPGYAVEYDFIYPIQLYPTLESKPVHNLYCAGQINGTSGYEEAAAQGFMAGVNAVLKVRDEPPFVLKRHEAYIGVLIDDLVTKNTLEPYRMFTSLAEHRLNLRIDNTADRLMHYGAAFDLVPAADLEKFTAERKTIADSIENLKTTVIKPEMANPVLNKKGEQELNPEHGGQTLFQLLKRPGIHWDDINAIQAQPQNDAVGLRVEIEVKYEGYINREQEMIKKLSELEDVKIPVGFDYRAVNGLSNEAKGKLQEVSPMDLDQASRIQGISPSDILTLLMHLKKRAA